MSTYTESVAQIATDVMTNLIKHLVDQKKETERNGDQIFLLRRFDTRRAFAVNSRISSIKRLNMLFFVYEFRSRAIRIVVKTSVLSSVLSSTHSEFRDRYAHGLSVVLGECF
jgi:hypothetical protein